MSKITNNMPKKDVFDNGQYPAINLGDMLKYLSIYSVISYVFDRKETNYKGRKNTV